jgi:hypothetical protein
MTDMTVAISALENYGRHFPWCALCKPSSPSHLPPSCSTTKRIAARRCRPRGYGFSPAANCVFEQTCLRDIAAFCEGQTSIHRLAARLRNVPRETVPTVSRGSP